MQSVSVPRTVGDQGNRPAEPRGETTGIVTATPTPQTLEDRTPQELALQLSIALDAERRRIAEGLHDDVGQPLAAACMRLHELRHANTQSERTHVADELECLIRGAIDASRDLVFDLWCPVMPAEGFPAVLEDLALRFVRNHEVRCSVQARSGVDIEPDDAEVLYRVVRELLHNVAKHADASEVFIEFGDWDGGLEVAVRDDGRGIDPGARHSGLGLLILRERVARVGGDLEISTDRNGTRVMARLPSRGEGGPS